MSTVYRPNARVQNVKVTLLPWSNQDGKTIAEVQNVTLSYCIDRNCSNGTLAVVDKNQVHKATKKKGAAFLVPVQSDANAIYIQSLTCTLVFEDSTTRNIKMTTPSSNTQRYEFETQRCEADPVRGTFVVVGPSSIEDEEQEEEEEEVVKKIPKNNIMLTVFAILGILIAVYLIVSIALVIATKDKKWFAWPYFVVQYLLGFQKNIDEDEEVVSS